MISTTSLIEDIRTSIRSVYDLEEIGSDEFLVHTEMYYDDGDEFHIVLKVEDGRYKLTDEGHTMMWLSYEEYNFTDVRMRLLDRIIGQNNVRLDDERINVSVDSVPELGPALASMIQAIMQTADMRHLSRSNVASTFMDDIRSAFESSDLSGMCEFGKRITIQTGETIEPDVFIGVERPVLVFGAYNSERAKEVIINLLLAGTLAGEYRTVVAIDRDAAISQKDRDRLINKADRPIMGSENIVEVTEDFMRA